MGIEEKHLRNFILEKSYPTSSGGAVSGHLSASCGSQSKALQIYAYGKQGKIYTRKKGNKEGRQNEMAHFLRNLFRNLFITVEHLEV